MRWSFVLCSTNSAARATATMAALVRLDRAIVGAAKLGRPAMAVRHARSRGWWRYSRSRWPELIARAQGARKHAQGDDDIAGNSGHKTFDEGRPHQDRYRCDVGAADRCRELH